MSRNKLSKLVEIYCTFFKLGCFSFGGGFAMIPLIEHEVVERKKWLSKEKVVDVFAISQSIPGAIAMNSSAFVGYSIQGIPGAVIALFGNITPSLIIVLALSIFIGKFGQYAVVQSAFEGIRPAIIALIAYAGYKMSKTSVVDASCAVIAVISFIAAFYIHPIIIIVCGGIAGIVISYIKSKTLLNRFKDKVGM